LAIAMFLASTAGANALTITCIGEPISSRAIGGSQSTTSAFADSAITAKGKEDCFFSTLSPISRQIARVCPIRDENTSDEPGPGCRVKAEVVSKGRPSVNVIKRFTVWCDDDRKPTPYAAPSRPPRAETHQRPSYASCRHAGGSSWRRGG
jgi:hypothetical protein